MKPACNALQLLSHTVQIRVNISLQRNRCIGMAQQFAQGFDITSSLQIGRSERMTQNVWVNFSDPGLLQVTLDALAVAAWFYRPFLVSGEKPCGIAVFSVQLA